MLSGYLTRVCSTAAVVVFCRPFRFRLCACALSRGVSAVANLVEDILQLILVLAARREEGEVDHRPEAHIMVILVVGGEAQGVLAVVAHIIGIVEVVYHSAVGAVLIGVVHGGGHSESVVADIPFPGPVGTDFEVTKWAVTVCMPVVSEVIIGERVHRVATAVGPEGVERATDAPVERPQSAVEAEPVGR